MAFDVYVGTMTRYYRREWENAGQRLAREMGVKYHRIAPDNSSEPLPSADEISTAVSSWCKGLTKGLADRGCAPIAWDEGEHQPYFTERPTWDGYAALLVWAAYAEHPDLSLPKNVPASYGEDPAYQRSTAREFTSRYQTILLPQIWLPIELPFIFLTYTIASDSDTWIGSAFTLQKELGALRAKTHDLLHSPRAQAQPNSTNKGKSGILSRWFGAKPKPPQPETDEPPLSEAAAAALDTFSKLAGKACEHRLPIMLDY